MLTQSHFNYMKIRVKYEILGFPGDELENYRPCRRTGSVQDGSPVLILEIVLSHINTLKRTEVPIFLRMQVQFL